MLRAGPTQKTNYTVWIKELIYSAGRFIKTDLFIPGVKIFSDASWKNAKIPGLVAGTTATGIGIFMQIPEGDHCTKVQIQASAPTTSTPLQAEAVALLLAATTAQYLQVQQATFLTDNLTLARAAANRDLVSDKVHWETRKALADYILATTGLQTQVYHISRDLNGIAHSVAHQVGNGNIGRELKFALKEILPEYPLSLNLYRQISHPASQQKYQGTGQNSS